MAFIFATLADMQAAYTTQELTQLTDEAGTGEIDQARVDKELASASAVVEGYVAATYQLDPAAPVPQLLIDLTCDIARYRLYRQTPPENAKDRWNAALTTLKGIRAGTVKIDGGVETVAPRSGQILIQSGDREMSRRQMKGW